MKIIIKRSALLNALKFCNNIISGILTNPTLLGILFEVKDNEVILTCSNGTISGQYKIEDTKLIETIKPGKILIRAKLLLNVISKLKESDITIEQVDSSVIRITTKTFNSNINIQDDNMYPSINFKTDNFKETIIDGKIIFETHTKVSHATLPISDKIRVLNGVCFDSTHIKDVLEIAASDSYKLSYLKKDFDGNQFKFIIDVNTLKILTELINSKSAVHFYILGNDMIIKINNIIISNKMIEGVFPNVFSSFNKPVTTKFNINKRTLIEALERGLALVMVDKVPTVNLDIQNDKINIYFKSFELGNSNENVDIGEFEGNTLKVCLNANYLISLLKIFDGEVINFELNGELKPLIMKDPKDKTFKQLVLPMRVY